MKPVIPILVAAAVGVAVILRPVPPPASAPTSAAAGTDDSAGSAGWSSGPADAHGGTRGRRTPAPQAMVYVAGEVARPGVYPVPATARTRDVLALAGGARPNADLIAVNLAAHIRDGDEIVVPAKADPASAAAGPTARSRSHGRARRNRGAYRARADSASEDRRAGNQRACERGAGDGCKRGGKRQRRSYRDGLPPAAEIDVNTADAETLASIPGIGDGLAKRIVAFREQNGAFASVDELLDVAGITEHRLDAMLPYVVAL